ncbi:MAG: peptidase [Chitinophagaceae bacterium]|nr:peptidase [Chitinophagaceae bacterium]
MTVPFTSIEDLGNNIDWNQHISSHPQATFCFRCNTDAMQDAFIPKGAILAVDRAVEPKNGQVVVALVRGEFVVRKLQKNEYRSKLLAASRRYPDILMNEEIIIWGVVASIVIQHV